MSEDARFLEWMVNGALNRYLCTTDEAKKWFFDLPASTLGGVRTVEGLCDFRWEPTRTLYECEAGLRRNEDSGEIDAERFRNQFWGTRPDFRFWTDGKKRQLIVEGKGGKWVGRKDEDNRDSQAIKYFRYMAEFPAAGAVVYLVPADSSDGWLRMLTAAAEQAGSLDTRYGVVGWSEEFLAAISTELALTISESLVGPVKLLERALRLLQSKSKRVLGASA